MNASIRNGALALAVFALSIVAAPAAQASAGVCNQASPHWLGGGLVALDPPVTSPAARYTVDLGKLPGNGAGLLDAAANAPSLTCAMAAAMTWSCTPTATTAAWTSATGSLTSSSPNGRPDDPIPSDAGPTGVAALARCASG